MMGHRLSTKLLFYIVLCSAFFTLLATAFQLYMDYRRDMSDVHDSIQFIKKSYLPAIATSAWDMDEKQLRLQLQGALKLPGVKYLEIVETRTAGEVIIAAQGNPNSRKDIVHEHTLQYPDLFPGGTLQAATLRLTVSLEGVYQRLWAKALIVLASNAVKMFMASFFIFLIIQFLITRHITRMAKYTQQLDMDKLDRELVLDLRTHKSSRPDELDELVTAFHNMQVRLAEDIEERKQAEEELRERKEFSDSLIALMQDGFIVLDSHGVHIDVNIALCQMTGFSREELIGVGPPHPFWPPEAYEEIETTFQQILRGEFIGFELPFMRKNGERFPVIVSPSWIKDEQGNVISYFATIKNITARKQAEEQIQASLREKELLLKEIHHRVKNNLQVISSLLDLSSLRTQDKKAISVFTDARSKIQTMALIHSQVYHSERFDKIDMGNHVRELVSYLSEVYAKNKKITPIIEISDVYLSIDQAIPCALICNELISNAYKHAFKEDHEGIIEISMQKSDQDTIYARIKDNGTPIPEEIDIYKTNTLGLKLARNLVQQQLKGKMQLKRNKCTEFIIEFKIFKKELNYA